MNEEIADFNLVGYIRDQMLDFQRQNPTAIIKDVDISKGDDGEFTLTIDAVKLQLGGSDMSVEDMEFIASFGTETKPISFEEFFEFWDSLSSDEQYELLRSHFSPNPYMSPLGESFENPYEVLLAEQNREMRDAEMKIWNEVFGGTSD